MTGCKCRCNELASSCTVIPEFVATSIRVLDGVHQLAEFCIDLNGAESWDVVERQLVALVREANGACT